MKVFPILLIQIMALSRKVSSPVWSINLEEKNFMASNSRDFESDPSFKLLKKSGSD